jgi:hypothetical protein
MIQEKVLRKVKLQEKMQVKEEKRAARERVAVGVLFGAEPFDDAVTTTSSLKDAATRRGDSGETELQRAEQC